MSSYLRCPKCQTEIRINKLTTRLDFIRETKCTNQKCKYLFVEKDFDTVSKRWKSDEYFDNSDSDLDDEKNDDDFNDNDENDYEFNNDNNEIFTEENIQNAYRKALFHKNKK